MIPRTHPGAGDGTGRRSGLKTRSRKAYGFEPHPAHQSRVDRPVQPGERRRRAVLLQRLRPRRDGAMGASTARGGGLLRPCDLASPAADPATALSREHLRQWCGDTWPEDDFSVEQNRDDLADHIEQARSGSSLRHTVSGRTPDEVLGSVWPSPAAWISERHGLAPEQAQALARTEALVDYGLLPSLEDSPEHGDFLRDLAGRIQHHHLSDNAVASPTRGATRIAGQRQSS